MVYNYVDVFLPELQQKYARELTSAALTTDRVQFVGAKTIKIHVRMSPDIKITTVPAVGTGKTFPTISN